MDIDAIRAAYRRIRSTVERTPLAAVPADRLPRRDVELLLKLECRQRSGAFKARGATHFLERLREESPSVRGVVTYSSGNHGRAVAEAARAAGLAAVVTVPDGIDPSKAAAITAAGAELIRAGGTSESRREAAIATAESRGFAIVPPFDHDWIIAGQGTVGLEILDEVFELAGVWIPVGGGGLAAGVATAIRAVRPEARIYGVEPEGAASLAASLAAGTRTLLERAHSVADGLLPLQVGERNWAILSEARVEGVTVSEEEIVDSLRILRALGIESEPSGAVAAAPLLLADRIAAGGAAPPGTHVAIVSGGNVAPERLRKLLGADLD